MPERGGRAITLQDLATHTSGLPRMPTNFAPKDPANPYADYSVENLYAFLSGYQLTRDIGSQYEYSNLGGGLLGHALTLRRAGDRLRGAGARAHLDAARHDEHGDHAVARDEGAARAGHTAHAQPVANWDLPTLAGAGALRSTTNDLLTFLAANIGYVRDAARAGHGGHADSAPPDRQPGLGGRARLARADVRGKEIVWHNGGTGGYRTFIGFDPKRASAWWCCRMPARSPARTTSAGTCSIAALPPQAPPKRTRKSRWIRSCSRIRRTLSAGAGAVLTITRDGGHLFAQLTGQPIFEIFPESERTSS